MKVIQTGMTLNMHSITPPFLSTPPILFICLNFHTGQDDTDIATHLLQFMFIGSTGFKFPICYFPTIEADPTTLYHQFWNAVFDLGEFGFKVLLSICDGATANRTFVQCHFNKDEAVTQQFTTTNMYTGEPLVFMVDPSVSINDCLFQSHSNCWVGHDYINNFNCNIEFLNSELL